MERDGPLPTTFSFVRTNDYVLVGNVIEETESFKSYDETFQIEVAWFKDMAVFTQKVKLKKPGITIRGNIEFMLCTDEMCLPPDKITFAIDTKSAL